MRTLFLGSKQTEGGMAPGWPRPILRIAVLDFQSMAHPEAHCLRVVENGSPHHYVPGMQEWWNGIHTWLRTTRLQACRFESCLLH